MYPPKYSWKKEYQDTKKLTFIKWSKKYWIQLPLDTIPNFPEPNVIPTSSSEKSNQNLFPAYSKFKMEINERPLSGISHGSEESLTMSFSGLKQTALNFRISIPWDPLWYASTKIFRLGYLCLEWNFIYLFLIPQLLLKPQNVKHFFLRAVLLKEIFSIHKLYEVMLIHPDVIFEEFQAHGKLPSLKWINIYTLLPSKLILSNINRSLALTILIIQKFNY